MSAVAPPPEVSLQFNMLSVAGATGNSLPAVEPPPFSGGTGGAGGEERQGADRLGLASLP